MWRRESITVPHNSCVYKSLILQWRAIYTCLDQTARHTHPVPAGMLPLGRPGPSSFLVCGPPCLLQSPCSTDAPQRLFAFGRGRLDRGGASAVTSHFQMRCHTTLSGPLLHAMDTSPSAKVRGLTTFLLRHRRLGWGVHLSKRRDVLRGRPLRLLQIDGMHRWCKWQVPEEG